MKDFTKFEKFIITLYKLNKYTLFPNIICTMMGVAIAVNIAVIGGIVLNCIILLISPSIVNYKYYNSVIILLMCCVCYFLSIYFEKKIRKVLIKAIETGVVPKEEMKNIDKYKYEEYKYREDKHKEEKHNEPIITNYCPKCNRIEEYPVHNICSICGHELRAIS